MRRAVASRPFYWADSLHANHVRRAYGSDIQDAAIRDAGAQIDVAKGGDNAF